MECLNKTGVESSENNYKERRSVNFLESTYKMIVEDLIGDAILEVCFEVHRAAKLGYLFLEYPEPRQPPRTDSDFTRSVVCPVCAKKKGPDKFAKHLADCMNLSSSTLRTSSRVVSQKIADTDAYFDDSDDSDSGGKKKGKKAKNARRKTKVQGNSSSKLADINANYSEMTPDKIQEFLNLKCGVITKRNNRMCTKTMKCSQHTDEERRTVRLNLLNSRDTNGQIDVDVVGVTEDYHFMMETESVFPSQ